MFIQANMGATSQTSKLRQKLIILVNMEATSQISKVRQN